LGRAGVRWIAERVQKRGEGHEDDAPRRAPSLVVVRVEEPGGFDLRIDRALAGRRERQFLSIGKTKDANLAPVQVDGETVL
jgi:hypothetical protein